MRERLGIPIDILPPRPRASARAGRHTEPPRGAAVAGLLEPPYRLPHSPLATAAPYLALDKPEQPSNPCVGCAPSLRSCPYNDNGKQHNVTSAHSNHDFLPGEKVLLRVHGSKGQAVSSMNMSAARSSHISGSSPGTSSGFGFRIFLSSPTGAETRSATGSCAAASRRFAWGEPSSCEWWRAPEGDRTPIRGSTIPYTNHYTTGATDPRADSAAN